jgi:hypothetical protein
LVVVSSYYILPFRLRLSLYSCHKLIVILRSLLSLWPWFVL